MTGRAVLLSGLLAAAAATAADPVDLSRYRPAGAVTTIPGAEKNASGLAFRPDTASLVAVINKPPQLVEFTPDGRHLRTVTLEEVEDPEGVAYLGSNRFAVVEERAGNLLIFHLPATAIRVTRADAKILPVESEGGNSGLEGVAWDAAARVFYAIKEKKPRRMHRVTTEGAVKPAWDMEQDKLALEDLSDVTLDPAGGHMVLLSHKSKVAVLCTKDGKERSRLAVEFEQAEGIAFAPDGTLYICSEPNLLQTYRPAR